MGFTQDLFTSRRNYDDGTLRVGQNGRLWYDHDTNSFRVSDGTTPGGLVVGVTSANVAGVGLSVNGVTDNVVITSNATHLNLPGTIVARDSNLTSNIGTINATNIRITGNLTVLGQTTYVQQQTLALVNHQIILSNVAVPTDAASDNGGLILKGNVDHTFLWNRASNTWVSSESISVATGQTYKINGVNVVTPTSVLDSATTANLATAGTDVHISATTGNTHIRNNLLVTGNLSVTGSFPFTSNYDLINFNTGISAPSYLEGRMFYDNVEKSLAYYSDSTDLTLNIGQETVMRATNKSGVTIFSGNAVYVSGALGDRPLVARAQANSAVTSQVIGIATTTILDNGTGYITLNGVVHDIDTAGMTDGAPLYLSPITAGAYTTTRPSHPNYEIQLGYVTRVNKNNGHFVVNLRNMSMSQLMVNGEANFESNVIVDNNITVSGLTTLGAILNTTSTNFTLANSTATTMNIGGAATSINLGASSGTTTIRHALSVGGETNLQGNLTTSRTSINLVTTNATAINLGTSATAISMASSTGQTTINNSLVVGNDLTVNGSNATFSAINVNFADPVLTIGGLTAPGSDDNKDRGIEFRWHTGATARTGFFGWDDSLQAFTIIPNATNSSEIFAGTAGDLVVSGITATNQTLSGNLAVNGGIISTTASTARIFDTTATTIEAFNAATNLTLATAATSISLASINGTTTVNNNLSVGKIVTIGGGNLNVTTTTFNLAPTASDLRIGEVFGTTRIRNNLDVDGDINFDGGYITASTTAVNLLNTNQIVNAFTNATTLNLGSASGTGTTTINNNLYLVGNLLVNGTQVTYNSAVAVVADPVLILGGAPPSASDDNKDRGIQFTWHTGTAPRTGFFGWDDSSQAFTVIPDATNIGEIFNGTPGDAIFSNVTGTSGTFTGSFIVGGSLAVNGTGLNTSSSTFNLVNSGATLINFGGSAQNLFIGSTIGTTNVRNNLSIDLDLNIDGGDITTNKSTFNLLNSPTTINFAQAATSVVIGAASGTTNVRNNLDIDLDLNIDGGDITTNTGSFNLLNTNAVVVNAFGAASVLNLANSGGLTTIRNSLDIDGTLNIDGGTLSTNGSSFNLLNLNATNVNAFAAATNLQIGNSSGTTIIRNNTNINNNLDVDGIVNFNSTLTVDGRVDIDGLLDVDNSADILLDLAVGRNLSVFGNLTIGSPGFSSTSLTFDLVNIYTRTINAFGDALTVNIGNTNGTTNINHNLEVKGQNLTTNKTTFNLVNTNATTLNFAGAATSLVIGATTGLTQIRNNVSIDGTLNVNGVQITVAGPTLNLANTNATTVNAFGDATSLTMAAATGTTTIRNDLAVSGSMTVTGSLTVNGSVTTVNSTTITVDDKNIELGSISTPTDITADGGGITLRGTTSKTLNWINSSASWTSSENFDLALGKEYRINNVLLANTTTLGSSVIYSSLTTIGTINSGTWQASIISPTYGGTGVNNGNKSITLGGNFNTSGNFNLSLVLTAATSLTLPTTGTLATLAGSETLTNKTVNLANNTLSGTLAEFNSALSGADFASLAGTETLTNKTINLANNTLSGTLAQFNTAVSDADLASLAGTETLTNKTVNLANNTLSGTLSQFNAALSGDDFASLTGTETLTNKTINLANNTLSGTLAEFNSALSNGDFASLAGNEILTNKTINLTNNTLSGTRAEFNSAVSDGDIGFTSGNLSQFAATTSAQLASVITDETGTGLLVFNNSPTLITPTLGVASATSINKVTITAPATSATLTIANSKTLTVNNSLTFTGTDASTITLGAGGTVVYTSNKLSALSNTSSSELAGVISDETGTGFLVFNNSPSLITPTLGAASATSVAISTVLTMTPLAVAPSTPVAGTVAIADNQNWNPASRSGNRPYPVFYDGNDWLPMITI